MAGAGSGDDGRTGRPARRSGGWAGADTGPVEIGPLYVDKVDKVDKRAPEPSGGMLEADECEDLPTLPPAPAPARSTPALRWAQVGQSAVPSPGVTGPQRNRPATVPSPPEQGPSPGEQGPFPGEQAPLKLGAGTRPGGRVRPEPRDASRAKPGGRPSAMRATSAPAPSASPRPDPTQPLPATRTQVMAAGGAVESFRPTAAITAPERPRRRGRALFWLLAVVAVVAASASAAIVLAGREASKHLHMARVLPGEALFEQLMATSATAQQLTATAVARSCTDAAPGAAMRGALLVDLNRAIGLRQSVLRSLEADRAELLGMPDGPLLVSDLNAATLAELTVDQDDQGWLQDLQATGCYSAPTNDIHYRAAGLDAPAAAGADTRLADAWAVADPAAD